MALLALLALVASSLLAVTWLVYPAAVVVLARLAPRRRTATPDGALATVTCVLATRDEAAVVVERVADFLASAHPADALTVVVAVDPGAPTLASELRARGGVLADPRVALVDGDADGGKCPTLNAGVRAATGEILVFSDSRQRFEPTTIPRLVAHLRADPRVGATSGRLLLPRDEKSGIFRRYLRYELAIRSAESRLHSAVGVSGSVYAMRRALWTPLPAGLILDDLFVPMRLALAGWRVGFVDDAIAHETRKVEAAQEYRRKVRTLTGNFQLCAWLPAILLPIRNPIWLQFVCHKLLRLVTPWCAAALAIAIAGLALRAAGDAAPWLVGAATAGALWLLLGRDGIARRLRGAAAQFAALQAAVVTATVNGVRGRWDVWKA